jgi:transposase
MASQAPFELASEAIGALPIVNHFLERSRIETVIRRYIDDDRPSDPDASTCLGVLLRNIVLDRGPVYSINGWGSPFRPDLIGIKPDEIGRLNDDRIGRALDLLFDADRATMMTETVVHVINEFNLGLDQFHNDSTTLSLSGLYREADGRRQRGKNTVKITFGHSKDHRPDLKQLLWALTVTADGAVPVHYKLLSGNIPDSPTHRETWETIRTIAGRSDFLYVADSKLCVTETLNYIDSQGGKFITVLPRTRKEDGWFREYLQTHNVPWTVIAREKNQRNLFGPPNIWKAIDAPVPSSDGYRAVWLWSSLMAERDRDARESMMVDAIARLELLETKLRKPRTKLRTREKIVDAADTAIGANAKRWVDYEILTEEIPTFHQERRGRPGPDTRYTKNTKKRYHVNWLSSEAKISYDAKTDGMFPLLTNCRDMPLKTVYQKYKFQPRLEKRHEQLKTVYRAAKVLLKKITRIEGLLFLYFQAMLVQSLIEREVRVGMIREGIKSVPIYPEGRPCRAPTTDKILKVFQEVQVHHLLSSGNEVQLFQPQLSPLQLKLIRLMGVNEASYACA